MKDLDKDILKETSLKECPFSVPEDYFDSLRKKVMRYPEPVTVPKSGLRRILLVTASVAATMLIMVTAGTLLLDKTTPEDTYTQEDYLVFSDNITEDLLYDIYAEADIMEEVSTETHIIK